MLKKICRLFLGLVVCASSACVTPTHASSASSSAVIITKIQPASPVNAKDELIELFNTTADDISLSGWCLTNKSLIKFACFDDKQGDAVTSHAVLPARMHATIISSDFLTHNPSLTNTDVALIFTPTNQSSGSLVASSDSLTLIDANGEVEDAWSWQAPVSSSKLLARQVLLAEPLTYATTGTSTDWQLMGQSSTVRNGVHWVDTVTAPEPEVDPPQDQAIMTPLQITELLPDATGSDTGNEFIEVYNPNLFSLSGADYKLLTGTNLDKAYALPINLIVAPLSYAIIKNDVVKFSLSNTAGAVQLTFKAVKIGEPIVYTNPPEGESWALIGGVWQYTNVPTPGASNQASQENELAGEDAAAQTGSVQKPCADNQYRNPATGRCRLIATAATQAPCKENQTRHPDTGRCRNNPIVAAVTPCKSGQERNPETNRCRNITKMSKVGSELKLAEKTQTSTGASWYVWIGIGGVVLAILSYAVWEWREELQQLLRKFKRGISRQ